MLYLQSLNKRIRDSKMTFAVAVTFIVTASGAKTSTIFYSDVFAGWEFYLERTLLLHNTVL